MASSIDSLIEEVRKKHRLSGLTLDAFARASGLKPHRLAGFHRQGWNPTASTLRALLDDPVNVPAPTPDRQCEQSDWLFGGLAARYLELEAYPRKRSALYEEQMLQRHILPVWSGQRVRDLTSADVLRLIDAIADTGYPSVANRVLGLLRQVFTFAMRRGVIDFSPASGIRLPSQRRYVDRILTTEELRHVWHELDPALPRSSQEALRFQLVTAQRIGEVIGAHSSEFSRKDRVWQIPSERSKNRGAHVVPMSDLAWEVMEQRLAAAGADDWLFSLEGSDRPLKRNSVSAALVRGRTAEGIHVTTMDLRRTAATGMIRLGASRTTVMKVLNHCSGHVIERYDWHAYDEEKRDALERWSEWLRDHVVRG